MIKYIALAVLPFLTGAGDIDATSHVDLIQTVTDVHDRINSLLITYRATNLVRGEVSYGNGSFVLRTIAVKGERRFARTQHIEPGQSRTVQDPEESLSFYDAESFNAYFPYDRIYEINTTRNAGSSVLKLRAETFLEALAWWPSDDLSERPVLSGRPFFIRDLAAKESIRTTTRARKIDGHSCRLAVVEGLDYLWIDPSIGQIVERQRMDGQGRILMHYKLRDFRDVKDGLKLPFHVTRIEYSEIDGEVLYENTYAVESYDVNNVPDAIFQFCPFPGLLIYDRDTDQMTQVPGGIDLIDELVDRSRSLIADDQELRWPTISLLLMLAGFAGGWVCTIGSNGCWTRK